MVFDSTSALIYPNLDTSKLSDEELQLKISDLNKRLVTAYNTHGYEGQMVAQLKNLQSVLAFEQYNRAAKASADAILARQSDIIESEPDLRVQDHKKETKAQSTAKPEGVKKSIPIITKSWIKGKLNK